MVTAKFSDEGTGLMQKNTRQNLQEIPLTERAKALPLGCITLQMLTYNLKLSLY